MPGARALLLAEAAFFLIHTHLRGPGSRSGSESGVLRAKGEWDMALQPPSSVSEGPGGIEHCSSLWILQRCGLWGDTTVTVSGFLENSDMQQE